MSQEILEVNPWIQVRLRITPGVLQPVFKGGFPPNCLHLTGKRSGRFWSPGA